MKRQYFSMTKSNNSATINIYGDITSLPWFEGDVSANSLSKQLETLGDVSEISVYINSYGGEVAEGLAIYNALKRHKAKIKTYCDGFACSIASVIFMAGDERIMNESSLLMIHNAWNLAQGNAEQLRKQADDLDKINQGAINAYKSNSTLSEEEIKSLMDAESWILPEEAIEYGFATAIENSGQTTVSQNAKMQLVDIIKQHREKLETDEEETEEEETTKKNNDDEEGDELTSEETETEENSDEEENSDNNEDEEDSEDEEKQAAQKLCGFFNALLKM